MAKNGGGGSLRQWEEPSYSNKDGRSASSLESGGKGGRGGTSTGNTHGSAAHGVGALDKSGSADPGRRKWGGSEV